MNMKIPCKNCGFLVQKPPEPAETFVMDRNLKFLCFEDLQSMEDHCRLENCSKCGLNVMLPGVPSGPATYPAKKRGWPKGKPRGPRSAPKATTQDTREAVPLNNNISRECCRKLLFTPDDEPSKRRKPQHRPELRKMSPVDCDTSNIYVQGPTLHGKQDKRLEPTAELTPPLVNFALSPLSRSRLAGKKRLGPDPLPKQDEKKKGTVLTGHKSPSVRMRAPTRAGRKAEAAQISHLKNPERIDPDSLPVPLSPQKLPPCGNDFDRLGCVCSGWNLTPEEMYDDHCGKADCVLECVCPKDEAIVTPKRRESFSVGVRASIGARDHGEDLREEFLAAHSTFHDNRGANDASGVGIPGSSISLKKLKSPLMPRLMNVKMEADGGIEVPAKTLLVKKKKATGGLKKRLMARGKNEDTMARSTLGDLINKFGVNTNITHKAMPRLAEFQDEILVDYVADSDFEEQALISQGSKAFPQLNGKPEMRNNVSFLPVPIKQEAVYEGEKILPVSGKVGVTCDTKTDAAGSCCELSLDQQNCVIHDPDSGVTSDDSHGSFEGTVARN